MTPAIQFGAVANNLKWESAARAVAKALIKENPEQALAVFHSGQDYAVASGEDAVMLKAMFDAREALKDNNPKAANDLNRRLDNWLGGMPDRNDGNNTYVKLLEYHSPNRLSLFA